MIENYDTSELATLTREFRHGYGYVNARLDSVDTRLTQHTTELKELRSEMKTQGEELRAEMKAQGEELRAEMKAQGEDFNSALTGLFESFERSFEELRKLIIERTQGHKPEPGF